MVKVYAVSRRLYKRAYQMEPFCLESIVKMFDSQEKAANFICESIRRDHQFSRMADDVEHFTKYEPNLDGYLDGRYVKSTTYDNGTYRESVHYKLTIYDVE